MLLRLLPLLILVPAALAADAVPARAPKDALKGFHNLIGTWKGTGTPTGGTREERDRGFWVETIRWQWQFKGKDAWLSADIEKGKHFTRFELRYQPKSDDFSLVATTTDKQTLTYTGTLVNKRLTVDRIDPKTKQTGRLVFSLLHANRHLYTSETRADGLTAFAKAYQVGATKQGVPFAAGDTKPECVVSGGLGTMTVTYMGKTYYVCCSGCREAFKEEPAKYVKEFEARKKEKR
jgi:YHS domain